MNWLKFSWICKLLLYFMDTSVKCDTTIKHRYIPIRTNFHLSTRIRIRIGCRIVLNVKKKRVLNEKKTTNFFRKIKKSLTLSIHAHELIC